MPYERCPQKPTRKYLNSWVLWATEIRQTCSSHQPRKSRHLSFKIILARKSCAAVENMPFFNGKRDFTQCILKTQPPHQWSLQIKCLLWKEKKMYLIRKADTHWMTSQYQWTKSTCIMIYIVRTLTACRGDEVRGRRVLQRRGGSGQA